MATLALTLNANAAELPGKDFSSNDFYQISKHIAPNGPITFETEIYIPVANRSKRGVLISNYNNGAQLGAWSFEVTAANTLRAFNSGDSVYGNVVFDTVITDEMGTDDANPKYVKIAVTVDANSTSDNVKLYVNGVLMETKSNANAKYVMYNTTQTINDTTTSNKLSVGGDLRPTNKYPFLGSMKNLALYSGIRDYTTATYFDTSDATMLFGYDMTTAKDRFFEDKSGNNNHAINMNYDLGVGKDFSETASTELYKMSQNIKPGGPVTFEAEIYVPVAQRSSRTGAIISNYKGIASSAWAFEIMPGGKLRLFTQKTTEIYSIEHSITQYMGNDDANPVYAKIAVTIDTSSG